jgi:hypothetical protein
MLAVWDRALREIARRCLGKSSHWKSGKYMLKQTKDKFKVKGASITRYEHKATRTQLCYSTSAAAAVRQLAKRTHRCHHGAMLILSGH